MLLCVLSIPKSLFSLTSAKPVFCQVGTRHAACTIRYLSSISSAKSSEDLSNSALLNRARPVRLSHHRRLPYIRRIASGAHISTMSTQLPSLSPQAATSFLVRPALLAAKLLSHPSQTFQFTHTPSSSSFR